MKLYLDTETYSETPITYGTYRYAEDSELMIATWAVDDGPVFAHDFTADDVPPFDLVSALLEADEVIAHNAMFDRNVIAKHLPNYSPPIEKWRCCMVRAYEHSLPGSLGKLCEVFQIEEDKSKHQEGRSLVQLFCKPRPKNTKIRRATRLTHPEEWQRFIEYARADISAMRAVWHKLPSWNYGGPSEAAMRELSFWHLDQKINDRGMLTDIDLAEAAVRAVAKAQEGLEEEVRELTGYSAEAGTGVGRATQRDELLRYILLEFGVELPDMRKDTLERRLADPGLPEGVKELLRVRLQATTTSTSKYKALLRGVSGDNRLRGTLQFAGAARTARYSGRVFQPQNLPSRGLLPEEDIEFGIEALKEGCADAVFGNVMKLTSSAIRGAIIAPKGKKLVIADLANIEGRLAAWLANEEWAIRAFMDYDEGKGHDLYKLAYARSFAVAPESVDKEQRQMGKVQCLFLQYQGGVGAFLTGAATYGIDLEDMAGKVKANAPRDIWEESASFYGWWLSQKRGSFGLAPDTFIACDTLKRAWRYANANIASYWKELEEGIRGALTHPGKKFVLRRITAIRTGAWLRLILPSGRALCYPSPRADPNGISYLGIDQYTKKWQRISTAGGKVLENLCQAIGRDVMVAALPEAEKHGYETILTVHDELVAEVPDSPEYNADMLSAIMSRDLPWTGGLPLAAAGFESYRYKKG